MNLIVHQVAQLQHVDHADCHLLLKRLPGDTVVKVSLSRRGQTGLLEVLLDQVLTRPFKHRCGVFDPQLVSSPAEMGLENLAHVHARGDAERVQHNLNRRAVRQERHVLFGEHAGDDALVAVTPSHLVTGGQLALHRDIDLHGPDHARRKLVALLELIDLLVRELLQNLDLPDCHLLNGVDAPFEIRDLLAQAETLQVASEQSPEMRRAKRLALADQLPVGLLVMEIGSDDLAAHQLLEALGALVEQDPFLVIEVSLQSLSLVGLDRQRTGILLNSLAREHPRSDDGADDAWRTAERCVLDLASFVTEDCPQQLFFRGKLNISLGNHFADKDVVGTHGCTDADDAAFIEVAKVALRYVRDVARDLLRSQLRITRIDAEFLHVERSVVVVLDELLAHQDGVFKVVPAPRHEGHQNIATEGELSVVSTRAVRQNLALLDPIPDLNDRLLINAGVLVRPAELDQLVDVRTDLAGEFLLVARVLDPDDDALGVDRIDDSVSLAKDNRSGIASCDPLHARADDRRIGLQQWDGLPLHVGSHQGTVCIVVLQERNQTCGDGHELLRAHIQVLDFRPPLELKVTGNTAVCKLAGDESVVVNGNVGLSDDILVFLPS